MSIQEHALQNHCDEFACSRGVAVCHNNSKTWSDLDTLKYPYMLDLWTTVQDDFVPFILD